MNIKRVFGITAKEYAEAKKLKLLFLSNKINNN